MGRSVVLPFFRRFSAAERNSGLLSGEDVSAFCSSLSYDLEFLVRSLPQGSISLKWSMEAMSLLKKMQVKLIALFKKAKLPVSFGDEDDLFDQYMKQTAAMLDFCNSLKYAISRIDLHRMLVDLLIQRLIQDDSYSVNNIAFKRFETETLRIPEARRKMEKIRVGGAASSRNGIKQEEKNISIIMLAAKCTMVTVSMILVSAMVTPASITISGAEFDREFPQLKPVVASLTALVRGFRDRMPPEPENGLRLALSEHKAVNVVVEELKLVFEDRERYQNGVQLLRTKSDELKEGLEMFDAAVDELFGMVIKCRNEMLDKVRDAEMGP